MTRRIATLLCTVVLFMPLAGCDDDFEDIIDHFDIVVDYIDDVDWDFDDWDFDDEDDDGLTIIFGDHDHHDDCLFFCD